MKIDSIRDAAQKSHVRISDHADEEAEDDGLTFDDIYFSVQHGEISENIYIDLDEHGNLVSMTIERARSNARLQEFSYQEIASQSQGKGRTGQSS